MSDSVRPHRRQPTRRPRPWDSPGKNTGVGCHFLLQCTKVKSESEAAQSCPTLVTPWTAAYQAPPPMGFSRQEYWSGVPSPSLTNTLPCVKHNIVKRSSSNKKRNKCTYLQDRNRPTDTENKIMVTKRKRWRWGDKLGV